ncbi:NACHT domain-containing protein [Rhizobium mongolense]
MSRFKAILRMLLRNVPTQLIDTSKKYYLRYMIKTPLDRRVSVVLEGEPVELRLSELRGMPCLVLLGEPGIGKSTALEYEASQEGGELLTCREAMNGIPIASASTAYLDALDEYRAGENGKDKLLQLANAITQSGVRRWRLTCRAEDWREAADMRAMRRAASEHPITVAHLLPLDDTEAEIVLSGLGEADPERFLADARARGAGAFLENPLSLQLLHSVVASGGLWPSTRFELFDRAIYALAHEHDPERVNDRRPLVDDIVDAAGRLSFYLLASGARALWRSNALAVGSRAKDFVVVQSLAMDPELADFSLDTAIFRGEGQTFEPSHRTIAEFLAGRFLAELVTGQPIGPLFPLARAVALITGNDHKAPSELRGLYAWFTAHLSQKGDEKGALRLIERDAATVLAYGDAAAFSTNGRRAIVVNLDRDDPFFLSSRDAITVFGGLAGDDLVPDFLSILDSEVTSHLQLTVLQALADGPPLVGMQNKLHEIAVKPARPLWQRQRAAEAWVKGSSDPSVARRRLIAELSRTTKSYDQISLRADVLSDIPTHELSHQEISDLLSDLNELAPAADGESEESGNLFSLLLKLKKAPRPDLFDQPMIRKTSEDRGLKLEVRHFMQASLADAINNNLDIGATRLWSWIRNTRDYEWDRLEEPLAKAIGAWIDVDTAKRELELFTVLLENSPIEEGPWMATNHYITIARRVPDDILIENLLDLAGKTPYGPRRRRLFKVAAYAVRSESQWPKWEGRIVSTLEKEGSFSSFIADLRKDPNKSWKDEEEKRKAKELAETDAARAHNIASLEPKINAIAAGRESEFGALKWGAELYRNAVISKKEPPLTQIEHFTNARIASAIAEGFVQFAIHTNIKVAAADLGKAEATNGSYVQEYVVAAGIHQALMAGREEEIGNSPPVVAIVALRQNYFSGDERPSLASWGVKHLARDTTVGSDEVLRYWHAALDAGDQDLDAHPSSGFVAGTRFSFHHSETPRGGAAESTTQSVVASPDGVSASFVQNRDGQSHRESTREGARHSKHAAMAVGRPDTRPRKIRGHPHT